MNYYWINLTHRSDRRKQMISQLIHQNHFRIQPSHESSPIISCLKSHYEAILTAFHDNVPYAVILEDDVVNIQNLSYCSWLNAWIHKNDNWDIIQLHYICPTFIECLLQLRKEGNKEWLKQRLVKGYLMSCAAYMISRKGIEKFLQIKKKEWISENSTAEEFVYDQLQVYFCLYPIIQTIENNSSDLSYRYPNYELNNYQNMILLNQLPSVTELNFNPQVIVLHPPSCHWFIEKESCLNFMNQSVIKSNIPPPIKIFFYATHPLQTNGYARIGNIIANFFASFHHIKVYYFGISKFQDIVKREVHPNIEIIDVYEISQKDPFGLDILRSMILKIEPDYLFLYNDILILYDIYLTLKGLEKRFQINLYMDLVYPYENISIIQELNSFCDKIFVFSSCWKKNLIEMKVPSDKIFIFPHGFDSKTFCCIKDPRKNTNFNINDFLILNTNRNTSRKCLDLTIQSFTQFLLLIPKSKRKNVYLLLNQYENETTSYDIQSIISMEEGNHSISISNQIIQIPNGGNISDQDLNLLYHISDIGLNTCNGEGFGLCNLEHGGIGKPQVITSCGAFQDIFNDDNSILVPPSFEIYVPKSYVFHEGLIQMVDPKNVANGLLDYYLHPNKKKLHGKNIKNHIANHYHWQSILTQFYNDFF